MKGVFTIGIDRRFADELAAGVLAEHGGDPLALADVLILLPTRRSVRALREAFLRASDGKPTLLPRLAPLGDLDESEWEVAAGDGSALALPPAIEPAEREALLAQLVAAFKDDEGHPIAQSAAQALKLARELGRLLDELAIEGVSFSQLEGLVEGNFASHWQRTLTFLAIVGEAWPKVLAERGQIDAIERRTQAIRAQAARWREHPPATPVIAAGSTGSQPATRDLLAAIAQLPQGAVVLPGLDRDMDEASWKQLDQSHPQFGLRELLAALGCERNEVADWPGGGGSARHLLITELMRPAETTEAWSRPPASSLEHVTRADCATPHQEALVVALALRETLKDEGRTAALVTPDRELARRVAAELRRWAVDIDDSAGAPLADTPPAALLRALVTAVDESFAPVALLALLKHPLCTLGGDRAALLDATRRLDRKCLRGLKPTPGMPAIRAHIEKAKFGDPADRRAVETLIDRLDAATSGLAALMAEGAAPAALLDATIEAAERIASAETLWSGEAGEALADALARLRAAWTGQDRIAGGEWPALLSAMLEPEIIRPGFGRHPRLAIWGPLEARLQRADLLVLGGLNEGTWPPSVETGPWINRPMRTALGLPQPERRIGLSAHDFAAALGAERVLLTRAEREGGAPTVPSRWLARLDALFGYEPGSAAAPPEYIQRGRRSYLAWADALDRPDAYRPWPRPEPTAADRGAADAAFGLQHRAMAARSLRALCAAHPGAGGARSAGGRAGRRRPRLGAARCARRVPEGISLRPAAARRHRPVRGAGREASRGPAYGTCRTRFLVAALPAPGALVRGHRERPPRGGHEAAGERNERRHHRRPTRPTVAHRSACRSHRRDRARRLGDHRLQDRPRALAQGAGRPVRAAAPARGGDGRAGRLRRHQGQGARRAPLLLAGQRPGRWRRGQGDQGQRATGAGDAGAGRQDGRALRQSRDALCRPAVAGIHPALQRLRPSRARRRMVDRRRRRGMSAALDPLALATDAQRRATTPGHSAWVEANAGTGKTKVLTDRVTRLLLDGVKPERILCLTFTKAAAAEMRNRLASQLGRWALADAGQARRGRSRH